MRIIQEKIDVKELRKQHQYLLNLFKKGKNNDLLEGLENFISEICFALETEQNILLTAQKEKTK